jgi:deazaflavin-dependent oxidoreductase (nitroreductase family)
VADKHRIATALSVRVVNPPTKALFRLGLPVPGTAILETTGRTSGLARQTPVTDGRDGDTFWIVAEHGRRAAYVRNLEAEPRVRVKLGRRWHTGTAHVLPDADPQARLAWLRSQPRTWLNAHTIAAMATDLLVVRVDLD